MRTHTRRTRLTRLTGLAVAAVLVGLASPAGAIPMDDPNDPGDPIPTYPRPDLRVSALAVADAGSSWSVSYTVKNVGQATASSSTVGFTGGFSRSVPALAVGSSSSGSILIPRADCYVLMSATADKSNVVREASETNNTTSVLKALPGCPPRYRVTATQFKAIDESGIDGPWVSDEPYFIFSSVATNGTAYSTQSPEFGDVDTGETRSLWQCFFGCSGVGAVAPHGMGLSIEGWEADGGGVPQTFYDIANAFDDIGALAPAFGAPAWTEKAGTVMTKVANYCLDWYADDLLGKVEFAYSPEYLALRLPATNTSFSDTRILGGSSTDATYSVTLQVTRVI